MENTIIFIDGNNWYHNLKKIIKPSKIDLIKLSKFLESKLKLKVKDIRYYNSIPNIKDGKIAYYKHMKFLSKLKKQRIIIKTRKLQKHSNK